MAQYARNGVDKGRQGPGRVMGITKGAFLPATFYQPGASSWEPYAVAPVAASR